MKIKSNFKCFGKSWIWQITWCSTLTFFSIVWIFYNLKLRIKDFIQLPFKSFSVSHKAWYHDSHSWYKPKVWISWITLTYKFASPRTNKKVMNRLTMQCNTAVTHEITFLRTSKMFDNLRTLTLKNRMFPTYAENGRLYLQVQENNEFV